MRENKRRVVVDEVPSRWRWTLPDCPRMKAFLEPPFNTSGSWLSQTRQQVMEFLTLDGDMGAQHF